MNRNTAAEQGPRGHGPRQAVMTMLATIVSIALIALGLVAMGSPAAAADDGPQDASTTLVHSPEPTGTDEATPSASASETEEATETEDLTITTQSLPDGIKEAPYLGTLEATGGTPPYVWTAADLPDWLTLDDASGELSGTPTAEGSSDFTVTVTDGIPEGDASRSTEPQSVSRPLSILVEGHGSGHGGGSSDPGTGEGVCTSDPCLICLAIAEAPYYQPAYFERTQIINGEGAVKENGPAANPVVGVHPDDAWGNIVPPVVHKNGKGTYPGLNWDLGQEIWPACGGGNPSPPPDDNGGHQRVDVCIATGKRADPYAPASFGAQQIINGEGKAKHNSPALNPVDGVFPAEVWGNIIEPFTHTNGQAEFGGLNWDGDGQQIRDAGCRYDPPTAPPPPPAPAPAAEPPTAVTEPQAVTPEPDTAAPVESATVVEVVDTAEVPADVDAAIVVTAPQAATLPTTVPAGGGGTTGPAGTLPLGLLLIGLGVIGLIASIVRLTPSAGNHN